MKISRFAVTGMSCSACSAHVEKCVSKMNGVRQVSVNLLAGNMQVEYDENILTGQRRSGSRQSAMTPLP